MIRVRHARAVLTALAFVAASGASAQSTPPAAAPQAAPAPVDDTIRLTDEQRLAILDHNTVESAAAARGELSESELAARGIHGEVGVMVGSHGSSAVYGAATIPLGDHAAATVMFENSRYGYRRY